MKRRNPPRAAVCEPLYHGGPAGLRRIDPPVTTGARSTAEYGAPARADRIYVTPDYAAALIFASAHESPCVYEVAPIGALEPDPDCFSPGLSFECVAAHVVRVHKPKWKHVLRARKALLS